MEKNHVEEDILAIHSIPWLNIDIIHIIHRPEKPWQVLHYFIMVVILAECSESC